MGYKKYTYQIERKKMVHEELVKRSKNIAWEYTSRPVSSWGGMRLMKELIDKTESLKNCRLYYSPLRNN